MKPLNVIIVTSERSTYGQANSLDESIRFFIAHGLHPILVLGPDGDNILSMCSLIDSCEIVFDPNYQGDFFSSVKAGLFAAESASFVWPYSIALPNRSDVQTLAQAVKTVDALHADRIAIEHEEKRVDLMFSLVTLRGLKQLRNVSAESDWHNLDGINTLYVKSQSREPRVVERDETQDAC